jgi:hypothetical protein
MNRDKSKVTKKNQIDNYRKSISYCIDKQHKRNHLLKLNMGFNSQIISNTTPDRLATIIANMDIKEHLRNNRTEIERPKQVESKLEDYPQKDGIKIVIHSHNIRLKTNRRLTSNNRISTEPTFSEH